MSHRSGRVLVAAAVATATAAAAALATTSSATAQSAPAAASTGSSTAAARSLFGHHSLALRAQPSATAAASVRVRTLTRDVIFPLQLAVTRQHKVLVTDAALNVILQAGRTTPVRRGPKGGSVTGIDVTASGDLAYTWSVEKTGTTGLSIVRKGHKRVDVNLSAFERRYNPDRRITYGVTNPNPCVADYFKKAGFPASYRGVVDSNPYAVKAVKGGWVVAEAAGNNLLFVDNRGRVRVLAVLPPQAYKFTAKTAAQAGLPACFAGTTYLFEPVPTDVEVGPDGALYLTTLPGGGETPQPARGAVWRLSNHKLRALARGFSLATNLAVTPTGRILVTELGSNRISTVYRGRPRSVIGLPGAVAVEYRDGVIYASTLAQIDDKGNLVAPGSVVAISSR